MISNIQDKSVFTVSESKIKLLKTGIDFALESFEKTVMKRKRKISASDLILFCITLYGGNASYRITNSQFINKKITNTTTNAYFERIKKLNPCDVNKISDYLCNFYYDTCYPKNRQRFIAIDGSEMALLFNFKESGYKTNLKKEYCKAKLDPLYDINTGLIINMNPFKNDNEQQHLISQTNFLTDSDVIVADSGFFSFDVVSNFVQKNINFLLRVKSDACGEIKSQLIIDNKEFDIKINIKGNTFRLVRYYINNVPYVILTTLFNFTVEKIKNIYWQRWHIETLFRELKEDHGLNDLNTKNENTLELKLAFLRLIYVIIGFLLFGIDKKEAKNIDYTIQINRKVVKQTLSFVYDLLFEKKEKKSTLYISKLVCSIKKLLDESIKVSLIYCKKGRTHERRRKTPTTKSYHKYYSENENSNCNNKNKNTINQISIIKEVNYLIDSM